MHAPRGQYYPFLLKVQLLHFPCLYKEVSNHGTSLMVCIHRHKIMPSEGRSFNANGSNPRLSQRLLKCNKQEVKRSSFPGQSDCAKSLWSSFLLEIFMGNR